MDGITVGPRALRYIPNGISLLRLILVLAIAFLIIVENHIGAFLLLVISGISDGLDGFIARRYGWVSAFGKLIGLLADKLMMTSFDGVIYLWLWTLRLVDDPRWKGST